MPTVASFRGSESPSTGDFQTVGVTARRTRFTVDSQECRECFEPEASLLSHTRGDGGACRTVAKELASRLSYFQRTVLQYIRMLRAGIAIKTILGLRETGSGKLSAETLSSELAATLDS